MTDRSLEIQQAQHGERLAAYEKDLEEVKKAVAALQDERNQALKWGIMSLGTAVIGMGVWIFNTLTAGHFK